ncbi:serine/threonine protein phosphatase [Geothrix rubra]|uniref:Serine/threonine protein phosphatase n=1 Tax=Geothrix rubra TaxID=2927977 RepID=A0ABQ5Q1E3_9BACT|nr:metallophosphoesterase family protein [Geothrix rubra]GLH68542.1 serine/threonine protein phosphatase [Geothrix rubra]
MDLILSDLHSNLHALRAVLRFARRRAIHRFILLGDLVGYGANPNQLLDRVRELRPRFVVRGNHDKVCAGLEQDGTFSLPARQAADWTRERLRQDNWRFLSELPRGPLWVGEDYQISHGSPMDEDAYLLHIREIGQAFDAFEGQLCFFGHTHLPGCFELDESRGQLNWISLQPGEWFSLQPHCRYLVNPGSVGQPRDRDPRVSFLTYDPKRRRVRLHRLEYDVKGAARAILAAGLHANLADRLAQGI